MPQPPSPERADRILRLFDEAAELDSGERRAYIERACADDPELRDEVLSLLSALDNQAGEVHRLLEQLPLAGDPPPETPGTFAHRTDPYGLTGQTIGPYAVQQVLGGGGMGVVYRAEDTRLRRTVALKFLPPHLYVSDQARERFMQEARAASALDHPNICTIYDIGETTAGQFFIAMAHYTGETLQSTLTRGPLPVDQALDYTLHIARGLAQTHSRGIIHRDIKPANVMVAAPGPGETSSGVIKILDFGLAKVENVRLTQTGMTMGTIAYMSPEQTKGEAVDPRTDVWSLGVVLYEMLTGELPFTGDYRQALVYSIRNADPEPVTRLRTEVPQAVEAIVDTCLAKDPKDRYATAADLLADLEAVTQRDEASIRGVHRATRRRKALLRRGLSGAGVVLVLLAVLLAIPSVRQAVWPGPPTTPERQRLAVLPLRSAGTEPVNPEFAEGLFATITDKLLEMAWLKEGLSVVPAADVRSERVVNWRQAERTFQATQVIRGSIDRSDGRARLSLELVDVASPEEPVARIIDMPASNRLAVQDSVVRKLAELLEVELDPETERALVTGGTTVPKAYEFYIQGIGDLRHGGEEEANIDQAVSRFEQAVAEDSLYTLAYAALGEAYLEKYTLTGAEHWADAAVRTGKHAIALNDNVASVHFTMGMIHLGTRAYRDAETEFLRMLELDPDNTYALEQLGWVYFYQGGTELTWKYGDLKKAIDLRPDDADLYGLQGYLYHVQGRHAEAEQQYREVTRLRPDDPWGYNDVGAQHERMGDYEEAAIWYDQAARVNPDAHQATCYAYCNLAGLAYRKENYAEAVRLASQARDADPEEKLAWHWLANASYWAEAYEDAHAAWNQLAALAEADLKINPENAWALHYAAEAEAKTGRPEQARSRLDVLETLPQKTPGILFSMARTYLYMGDREKALRTIDEALQNGLTLPYIALHAVWLGDLQADADYQTLIKSHTGATPDEELPSLP